MRGVVRAIVAGLASGLLLAQEAPPYTQVENPYQAEFEFVPGKPIELHVVVEGVRLDRLTIAITEQPRPGSQTPCTVELVGSSAAERKATLGVAVLLEDSNGRGLARAVLDPFKVKTGKNFDEKQARDVAAEAASAAKKLYLLVQVSF